MNESEIIIRNFSCFFRDAGTFCRGERNQLSPPILFVSEPCQILFNFPGMYLGPERIPFHLCDTVEPVNDMRPERITDQFILQKVLVGRDQVARKRIDMGLFAIICDISKMFWFTPAGGTSCFLIPSIPAVRIAAKVR